MAEVKDYVKDLSNEQMLSKNVFDEQDWEVKILTEKTEKAINDNAEKAYQDFLKEKGDMLATATDEMRQSWFNDFMDNVDRILDKAKIEQIKDVNKDIESSLRDLEFTLKLEELQATIQQQRENEAEEITLKDGIHIEWLLTKQVSKEQLDTLLNTIKTTNFTEKQYIVDCLNRGTKEDVRRIQYLLIWKKGEYQNWKWWNKEWVLSRFWTDWLMWSETFNALSDYIRDNKQAVSVEPGQWVPNWWPGDGIEPTGWSQDVVTDNFEITDGPEVIDESVVIDDSGNHVGAPEVTWGNFESKEMDLSYVELENTLNEELWKIASNYPKMYVRQDGDKYNLYIPKSLWLHRNMRVVLNPQLKQYMTESVNDNWGDYFVLPANIKIWLRRRIPVNVLVLWDYEDKDEFENLKSDFQVVWDPKKYDWGQDKPSFKVTTEYQMEDETNSEISENAPSGNVLDLSDIKSIEIWRAVQRADHEWSINLTWLKKLNTDVLHAFMNGKCKRVYFPGWILIKDDWAPYILIDGKKYTEVTKDVCKDLLKPREWVMNIVNGNANGNETRADVQQQYEWVWYNVDNPEATREAATDEEAIQYLTKGSWKWVFFIARLFGKKKHNEELSIVDANYEPTWQEKTDLNNLNKYLLECKDDPTGVFTKIFSKQKDFWDNENLEWLYDLYRECVEDQNWTKKWSYLKKVIWLLQRYFIGWWEKDKNWKTIKTFKDMYNNELLWVKKDLEKKERRAKKSLDDSEQAQLQEAGWTALEAANTKVNMKLPYEKFTEFKERYWFDTEAETQFAMCLCDLNADWRIDSRDMNAKTGQELFNMIKDAKVDRKYEVLEHSPMYNILSFATIKAEQDWHANTAEFLKWVDLTKSDEEIMNKLKERPLTIQYLRYMLINSPMNMANNIIRYGWVKVETNKDDETGLNLDKETQEAINKIMSHEKFEETYWNAYSQLVSQGLNDTPEIKKKLRPIIALALLESAWNSIWGLSWWFDWSLWNNRDMAFTLWVWYWSNWNFMVWVNAALWKSWNVGKHNDNILSLWASWWVNFAEWKFVPMIIWSLWFDQVINRGKLQKTLEERSKKYLWIDANWWLFFGIPAAWVWLSYSQDKMKGLNTTYESIRSDLWNVLKETLKDKRPDSTDKTEIRTQMVASIKAALESRFWRSRDKTLDQAAQNVYGWISYYLTAIDNPSKITDEQKNAIIEKVAENYANQRRNKAMSDLNWTKELERVRVWVEFLFDYWPLPLASVSFKTYGNLTADETMESMQNYYQRLGSGSWMAYIESSVEKEWPFEWYIKRDILGYLNTKLSVLSPSGTVPEISLITNNNDFKKHDLQIPRELCKYVNICYSPELKGVVNYEESTDSFVVPANIKVWLLTYSRSSEGKYNLILWDYKKWSDFVDLDINSTPEWDTSEYEWKEWELRIDESTINDNEKMQELFKMSDFPLSECVDSKDWKVFFKLKDWFNIDTSWNPKIEIKQWILSAPELWKLQITKTEQGTYVAIFDDSVKDKLSITYIDEKKAREYNENRRQELGLENAFDQYEELNNMFNNIETRLSRLDDGQWWNYADFMDYASDMIDGVLDENDYGRAFDKLKYMLSKLNSRDLSDTNLSALKQKIDWWNLSYDEKTLIVDRFKMLFSYHINLSDWQKDYANLLDAVSGRWNVYERLTGYNKEKFPLAWQWYREKILAQLKDRTTLQREVRPGLIGMTAFYRYNKDWRRIKEWRWYSMTEMWRTTVLWWAYEELTDDLSKRRFISNLKSSNVHQKILNESLTSKIRSVKWLENVTLSNDQLIQMLEWKDIDIWTKNIKIWIEAKYMFYLLWECWNESIWVNLEKLIIKGAWDWWDWDDWVFEVDINPGVSYENSAGISIDWVAAENKLNVTTSRSRTYWIVVWGSGKPHDWWNDWTGPGQGSYSDWTGAGQGFYSDWTWNRNPGPLIDKRG